MQFEFATATRIMFGRGAAKALAELARTFGSRPLLVGSRRVALADSVRFVVSGEPSVQSVRDGVAVFRAELCDVVVAIGGGSAIDAGKAIAALATNSGEPFDYLEVVGRGVPLTRRPAPFIAVPTTAGTGAEVTRNAVLSVPEHHLKASLRSPMMLPQVAVVDPELTIDLPPPVTASTGMDALTQLIEPYVSARSNAMTDMYCIEGLRRVRSSLLLAFRDGHDLQARTDMSFASLLGGLALANAGLGVVHGFAAPIGGMFAAPHGAVCAALLPSGMAANITALRSRAPEHPALARYARIASELLGRSDAAPEEGVEFVAELGAALHVPRLRTYGVDAAEAWEIVAKAEAASSMKANPIVLTRDELAGVLELAV